ncbi:MAG: nicotinamide mononucleotide transporter [Bacteroidetes bacterium]|jgi:nicotinamide mononucleotide transporter|nr:nicotinamide mononucleotide transporter [Bacteroidota bacterium]MBK7588198.1 nicotinamide mononucleotide transporter [Bacteroidota bacterium]MBK9301029.1 nicotinamide mononucleotide transporter [Bacteroidota bacterium]MBK9480731.1 nicotinamide mononucleotide transporter [Bacteroidota bacterium]
MTFLSWSVLYLQKFLNINILQQIITQCTNTSLTEWLAFLFGVIQVVLALKNKPLNFYAGILSVSLYIYVFYTVELYAESLLNGYYLIVSIAGIFLWSKKEKEKSLPITHTKKHEWIKASALFIALFILLAFILKTYTKSNVPYADALVTALAWIGTWLMIQRKLEHWLVLNLSNTFAIPLLIYKELELTALLTLIYFVIAILGYYKWKQTMKLKQP